MTYDVNQNEYLRRVENNTAGGGHTTYTVLNDMQKSKGFFMINTYIYFRD